MLCEPTAIHLARTATPSQYRVTWQSGEPSGTLRWRPAAAPDGDAVDVRANVSTYARSDVCGVPANVSIGWFDPGWIHTAVFDAPGPGAYIYSVGTPNCTTDTAGGALWSPAASVRGAPAPGGRAKVLFVGDMGEAPRDSPPSEHHWQMPSPTEVVDAMILEASGGGYDAVWHIGDLAYATGYTAIWEGFMAQIQPLAAAMPYYTSPGNHERVAPNSGTVRQGDDSGGECGVPFNARFIQPAGDDESAPVPAGSKDPRQPFYSDNVGPMHVIFASTEHDLHPGSEQYAFLARDLAAVDRAVTPHVVFTGHRPMYASSTVGEASYGNRFVAPNARFNWAMAEALEPLFQAHQVGLALWGHVHNYERTCAVLNQTCRAAGGTVHVTAGTAGASVTLFPTHNKTSGSWSVRTCASNGTDAYAAAADSGVSSKCRACADVTSCTAGHVPCSLQRCAPPPAWSVVR